MHEDRDQFFRVEAGEGELVIDGATHRVKADFAMIVPAGARHNVRNTGGEALKLYTVYGPPEHRRDVVHRTRADARRDREHFDGEARGWTRNDGRPASDVESELRICFTHRRVANKNLPHVL